MAQSMVLFIFSSNELLAFVVSLGLPPYPLIPVSSSQAVIGAVIGVGLTHGWAGARQIKWRVLGNIGFGWISTPIIAATISFFFLFFLQNVFQQQVYTEVRYKLSSEVIEHMSAEGIATAGLEDLQGEEIVSAVAFRGALRKTGFERSQEGLVIEAAEIYRIGVTAGNLATLDAEYLGPERTAAVQELSNRDFAYKWQLREALMALSDAWKHKEPGPLTKEYNEELSDIYKYLFRHLHRDSE
jgi:PiT family inorganic phosphate transporter